MKQKYSSDQVAEALQPARPANNATLEELAKYIRYEILAATTHAGSGHPTSAMSATDLMTGLLFGGTFQFDVEEPHHPNNDRLIFSKGHASPLFYALWAAAGKVSADEMNTYRDFNSTLEGHPTPRFPFTEAATGSLGQGLSIGFGMALNAKRIDELPYHTYVLLGDSEMAEGSQWEAIQLAAHYQLDNLIGVLDVNRLGQRGPTMYGHDLKAYRKRISAFGWKTIEIDGHDMGEIVRAFRRARRTEGRPTMIIAKTIKGKGVSFLENQEGWHGKALSEEQFEQAREELGEIDLSKRGMIPAPEDLRPLRKPLEKSPPPEREYELGEMVATRDAFGHALANLANSFPQIVSLDGEVSNSTRAEFFQKAHPDRFFEMFIAEQNMVGAAVGLSGCRKIPFVSTFAAFLTRAADQIRMAQYSNANIKFVGSHSGVSIGEDGPSQMGLEDIAMFRTIRDGIVLHPCDAISAQRLMTAAAEVEGIVYLRTMRQETPVVYRRDEHFQIGGSHVLRSSEADVATIVGAGATVHEALKAYELLNDRGIPVRIVDAYSIKPLDATTLRNAAAETQFLLTVEDHYAEGGLGEAISALLARIPAKVHSLAVKLIPRSGKPEQLLEYERISSDAIAAKVMELAR